MYGDWWGASSASPNPLAGFEAALRGGRKERKEKGTSKMKARKGKEGMGENIRKINFWLRLVCGPDSSSEHKA